MGQAQIVQAILTDMGIFFDWSSNSSNGDNKEVQRALNMPKLNFDTKKKLRSALLARACEYAFSAGACEMDKCLDCSAGVQWVIEICDMWHMRKEKVFG